MSIEDGFDYIEEREAWTKSGKAIIDIYGKQLREKTTENSGEAYLLAAAYDNVSSAMKQLEELDNSLIDIESILIES